jgi:hypothetical protein
MFTQVSFIAPLRTKIFRLTGLFFTALFLAAAFSACQSEPPPPPPPPAVKFSSQSWTDTVELNIEGLVPKPKMVISLALVDVPEAPDSPDAELRHNLRQFLRQKIYGGKEPGDYARGIIEEHRAQYTAQAKTLMESQDMPAASMNWEYTETVAAETVPHASKGRVFSRIREYYLGGAHGMREKAYVVANEAGAEQLFLDYFIQPGKDQAALDSLAAAELRRRKGLGENDPLTSGGYLADTVKTPGDNFFFNAEGIGFHWDPYAIAPYSEGAVEVVVPYSRLQDLLTAKGSELLFGPPPATEQ